MKPRDIILSQINHQETDLIPYTLPIDNGLGEKLDAHYGNAQWRDRLKPFMQNVNVVDTMKGMWDNCESNLNRDLYGTLWRTDLRPLHMEEPALKEPTFEGYDWPEPSKFIADKEGVAAQRTICDENKDDKFIITSLGWGLFESSWGMRGFENVLMDVAAEPEFFEELLDRLTEQILAYIEFTCKSLPDIDAIFFGDDWADQRGVIIGPERWRQLFKPRYARIYEAARAHGKIVMSHCCGSTVDILDDMIEIGLDVYESVQPEARDMNPYELKKRWGDQITFWGCLGSQSTIPRGTPAEIHAEVSKLRHEMGKGGGYILAPAKPLPTETPLENAVAIVEAFTSDE
ncbi:MAG: uroporphyrinogen decarboxylase family protein [Kiritimatiellia bacterium]|nr:uroporphyrinogen decarboxylase family protein [Kiritimatiellia bacterium]